MNRVLGIDQSLSKTAMVMMVGGIPVDHLLSKTGNLKTKGRRKDVTYYNTLTEQIHHICEDLLKVVSEFKPDIITFEALSFGSVGSATRDLSVLMGGLRETLIVNFPDIPVTEVAPTSLKTYARDFLKEESKWEGVLKTGKPKKCKMDKKKVVEAIKELYGQDYLKGYNYSTGLDDLADATFLAHRTWKEYNGT